MKAVGLIPSRYDSTRFPGKPLVDIHGKSMIRRVYEQAMQSKKLDQLYVATDDERIRNEVAGFNGRCIMTTQAPTNGTERCKEALERISEHFDIVINIQGDEPYIRPEQIDLLVDCFQDEQTKIATLIKPERRQEVIENNSNIKVVVNSYREALYFSRLPIPFHRNKSSKDEYYKHIGIYGYRIEVLKEIVQLRPTKLEMAESLEQLRWLENGFRIMTAVTPYESDSVDTPDDLEKILAKYA